MAIVIILIFFSVTYSSKLGNTIDVPGLCPQGIQTACANDGSQTCCPIFMSLSGYGCCNLPDATCCPISSTTQTCCPKETTCIVNGYTGVCVPKSGGANVTAIQVCTPGAQFPPSTILPSVITIGDCF